MSELGLRWLSIAAIAVAVASVAASGARLGGRWGGYLAGVLMAVNGVALTRAVEARPYAVGIAIYTLALFALARMRDGAGRSATITYGALLVAGLVVMPQGIAVVTAHGLWILWSHPSAGIRRRWSIAVAPLAVLAVVGALLAWLNIFQQMYNWLGSPSLVQLPKGILWAGGAGNAGVAAEAAVGLTLLLFGSASLRVRGLALGALAGLAVLLMASSGRTSFWLAGSFVPLVPIVVLAGATSIAAVPRSSSVSILLVLLMVSLPVYTAARMPRTGEADLRLAVAFMGERSDGPRMVFGDSTDAYGLWPAMKYYGTQVGLYEPIRAPQGQYWAVDNAPDCMPLETWDVGGNATLKLCAAASASPSS